MKFKLRIACLLLMASLPSAAQAGNPVLEMLNSTSARLLPFMTLEERKVARKIFFVQRHTPFPEVIALRDKTSHKRLISFNAPAYLHYVYLTDAIAYTSAHVRDHNFLFGYMRYLARHHFLSFNHDLKSPQEYAAFFGLKLPDSDSPAAGRMMHILRANHSRGIFEFLVAHETAHHVLGHTDKSRGSAADERQKEIAADKWAAEILIKSGNVSVAPIFLMLYFNERDFRGNTARMGRLHPGGIDRALILADYFIDGLQRWRVQSQRTLASMNIPYDYEKTLRVAYSMRGDLQRRKRDQLKAAKNPKYWVSLALNGDKFAQLKVASSYSHALNDFPHDTNKSIEWHKRIIARPHNFDYFAIAHSHYSLGYFYAFKKRFTAKYGRNIPLARKHLRQSARMGYSNGTHALKALNKQYP